MTRFQARFRFVSGSYRINIPHANDEKASFVVKPRSADMDNHHGDGSVSSQQSRSEIK
jgi:hypothetical protein